MAHSGNIGGVAVIHETVRGSGEGDARIQVAAGGGLIALLIEGFVHIGGPAGCVADGTKSGHQHRAVLGILTQRRIQPHLRNPSETPQGVEAVGCLLEGLGAHGAGGIGGGSAGLHRIHRTGHGIGIFFQQLDNLLLGQLLHGGGAAVPQASIPCVSCRRRRKGRQKQGTDAEQREHLLRHAKSFHHSSSFLIDLVSPNGPTRSPSGKNF